MTNPISAMRDYDWRGAAVIWGQDLYLGLVCVILVVLASIASGLTVGLLSMEPTELAILEESGDFKERYKATKIKKLIEQKHLVMVTLLITNSCAMEALPVFLDKLVPSWAAVMLSVTAILIFGEILPQAICTGPQQLDIAYKAIPLMNVLICITYPLSFPISKLLDNWFGHEVQSMTRNDLKTFLKIHQGEDQSFLQAPLIDSRCQSFQKLQYDPSSLVLGESGVYADPFSIDTHANQNDADLILTRDEIAVVSGALELSAKNVEMICSPFSRLFALEEEQCMDEETLRSITQQGYSRIPVYQGDPHNITGIILVKTLISKKYNSQTHAKSLMCANRQPLFVGRNVSPWTMLNEFQKGKTHLAFVVDDPQAYYDNVSISDEIDDWALEGSDKPVVREKCVVGVITIEDVLEKLIGEEIYDEYDFKKKPATHLDSQTYNKPPMPHPTNSLKDSRITLPIPRDPMSEGPSSQGGSSQNKKENATPSKPTLGGFTGPARSRMLNRMNSYVGPPAVQMKSVDITDIESQSNKSDPLGSTQAQQVMNAYGIDSSTLLGLQNLMNSINPPEGGSSSAPEAYLGSNLANKAPHIKHIKHSISMATKVKQKGEPVAEPKKKETV